MGGLTQSKQSAAVRHSLILTKNPTLRASCPQLTLDLTVPQDLISRHDTGLSLASGLKISDSEEKGSAAALKRQFLLGQPNTFLCGWIKANYLLGRRGPKEEAQPTLSLPFRTPSPPRPTFPAT